MAHESFFYIGVKAIIRNSVGEYLVLHVTRRKDNYTYWDLPGGRISDGESPIETLKREVAEETGIDDLKIERPVVMALSRVLLPLSNDKQAGIVFDVHLCSTTGSQLKLEENMEAKWCSNTEAAELLRTNRDYPASVVDAVAQIS